MNSVRHALLRSTLILFCLLSPVIASAEGEGWIYSGPHGPAHWAELAPEYSACGHGRNQSPVDIHSAVQALLPALVFDYANGGTELINNGHALQLNFTPGNTLTIDSTVFTLKQLHFHAPSEHMIDGKLYPLELHLVHADQDGNLAVVAILFERGAANPMLGQLWPLAPKQTGESAMLPMSVMPDQLVQGDLSYWRYSGSLTSPPCTEGVRWLVLRKVETASGDQIREYSELMHGPTNRPVQPLNARLILQ